MFRLYSVHTSAFWKLYCMVFAALQLVLLSFHLSHTIVFCLLADSFVWFFRLSVCRVPCGYFVSSLFSLMFITFDNMHCLTSRDCKMIWLQAIGRQLLSLSFFTVLMLIDPCVSTLFFWCLLTFVFSHPVLPYLQLVTVLIKWIHSMFSNKAWIGWTGKWFSFWCQNYKVKSIDFVLCLPPYFILQANWGWRRWLMHYSRISLVRWLRWIEFQTIFA